MQYGLHIVSRLIGGRILVDGWRFTNGFAFEAVRAGSVAGLGIIKITVCPGEEEKEVTVHTLAVKSRELIGQVATVFHLLLNDHLVLVE